VVARQATHTAPAAAAPIPAPAAAAAPPEHPPRRRRLHILNPGCRRCRCIVITCR
jgi:hypothetical protein